MLLFFNTVKPAWLVIMSRGRKKGMGHSTALASRRDGAIFAAHVRRWRPRSIEERHDIARFIQRGDRVMVPASTTR